MSQKVLVICPASAKNLGEAVKSIQGDVVFTMPDLSPDESNLELYFMKMCMSFYQYDNVLVLVTEDLFQLDHLDKVIHALTDLNLGVFIPIGDSYNYPSWFPMNILRFPLKPFHSSTDLWSSLFVS